MNENVKERIVETATSLFLFNGIKTVTMDAIAHKVGISKRTLYEIFRDKDELLTECLAYNLRKNEEKMKELLLSCSNSIEILLVASKYIVQQHHFINPNYFTDMKRYHPSVLHFFDDHKQRQNESTAMLLKKGIEEGVIRPDLNIEIVTLLLEAQIDFLTRSFEIFTDQFSFPDILETLVLNFARGVASRKGLDVIEAYDWK